MLGMYEYHITATSDDSLFDQDLSAWDTRSVRSFARMFKQNEFSLLHLISAWNVSSIIIRYLIYFSCCLQYCFIPRFVHILACPGLYI